MTAGFLAFLVKTELENKKEKYGKDRFSILQLIDEAYARERSLN